MDRIFRGEGGISMLADNKKISIRQACLIFLTVVIAPAVRYIPSYAAKHAKQAAWLAPIITVLLLYILSLIWQRLYKGYNDFSLMDIYSDISGKFIGKILAIIHFIWVIFLIALYTRYFAERFVGSILPNVNINIFIISILIVIAYALHYGLITLARANEIILPILTGAIFLIFIMLLPSVKMENLTPITYRDILPIFNASIASTGVIAYFSFIFIIGDKINNKENIKKIGFQLSAFILVMLTCLMVFTIGTSSYTIVERTQYPFFVAVKLISLFNTLEKIESIVITLWIMSDFILISFFIICAFHLMKYFYNYNEEKPLLNIFTIFIYFFTMYLCNNVFELEKFSEYFIVPGNIILGFGLPIIMLALGKIRNKI